ncbi:MAG: GAF domain-containing protein [Anaerolineae bacterium]|nr:GAF domain-containing protein [Anaerolineae bacterium]
MEDNVKLAKRRARLLQAAAEVGRSITSILDPDYLLERTVDIICDAYEFYYAGVFLVDETGEWAVLRAGRGEAGKAMLAEGHKLKVGGHSMIGAAVEQRKARIALDVGEEPVHFKNPHLPHTHSEMALPLSVGDAIIGAVTVQSTEEAAFSDEDISSLQAMADQLAVAISNARLHAENQRLLARTERRARLLEAAAQVGRDVTSILDMDELFHRMVDIICDAYGFYYAGVFLVDRTGEWAVLRAGRGEAGQKMVANGHRLRVGGHSMIGTAVELRKARIALDVGEEPVHFKNPYLPHTRSEMALPLVVGAQVIGAVTVQSVEEAAFSDEDIASLQAMADQLAVAINNARLLQELEAAHAELLRTKTFEAIATATIEAIHWIGNKALPISVSAARLRDDLNALAGVDPQQLESMLEDLTMIENGAQLIVSVQEHLIGPAREEQPRPVFLEDVVRDTALALGIPADVIEYSVADDVPLGLADTTQLSRAFAYVLTNAMEAMQDAQEQQIVTEIAPAEEGDFVVVRIADTGPGIPEKDLDKIWAAFYTTKGPQHAGLGLSAALQILKQIDGQILATNAPEGGAVFELLIPACDGDHFVAELPAGRSFLLIDDDDAWRRFVTSVLEAQGNTVVHSVDGKDVDLAAADLILLDVVMEGGDSLEVLKRLAQAGVADKTIVVASSLRVEAAMELMSLGVRDVVLKPYTVGELATIVG